jgi:two-component system chemotaxis sensor kinase CheA
VSSAIEKIDDAFYNSLEKYSKNSLSPNNLDDLDFIFTLNENNSIERNNSLFKNFIPIESRRGHLELFISKNPNILLKYYVTDEGETIFYGKAIDQDFLNDAAQIIQAKVSLIINDLPYLTSNENVTVDMSSYIVNSASLLKFKNNFDLVNTEIEDADFLAVKYKPTNLLTSNTKFYFTIFDRYTEAFEFRGATSVIMAVLIFSGVVLSIIFVILFTTRLRQQLSLLTDATNIISSGDMTHRVEIITKDEVGKLGETYNKMLDEIERKELIEKNYTEFVTLLNSNPSLKELGELILEKILSLTDTVFGALYLYEEGEIQTLAAKGIDKESLSNQAESNIIKSVIDSREPIKLQFKENQPVIKTGVVEVRIQYLLVLPILYGDDIISILEIASESVPDEDPMEQLGKIKDQLAIGISNAISYEKLENLVDELKTLNYQYLDQNERMKLQNEELTELHTKLQEKAAELEIEKTKAVELSHLKSQFLASMSHELRTPLNSIIGLSELTERDGSALPKTKDRVKIVLRNSKKLLSMINNILEFSKIESGKHEIAATSFLLSNLLNEIYSTSKPLFDEKKLEFNVVLKEKVDYLIKTDKQKLEHILSNLIGNAIKFTEKGHVILRVSSPNAKDLLFEVIDTGIGISEANQQHIFEEFKQLDSGNARKYSGAGLGLAICKSYAELLEADLIVDSKLQEGSNFSLNMKDIITEELGIDQNDYLVANIEEKEEKKEIIPEKKKEKTEEHVKEQETIITDSDKTFKILVVDDDNDTLFTVGEILQNLGYETTFATNGVECLNSLESSKPDLVLLDIMMPKMDGFETIKKIRSMPEHSNLLVVALTAHAMLDDKFIIEESGFNDLITKPIDNVTIQFKINQAIMNHERK